MTDREAQRSGLPRAVDIAIAAVALAIASPLLALAALAIKLDSRGPVIYRARRVGLAGTGFDLCKLRTMHTGNDPVGVGTPVLAGDPRVTRVGGLLRRFSLDELPNLFNVLRGEMSVVGPRPTLCGAGGRVHAAAAATARGQTGPHRVGAGQRSRRDPVGGADRARRLVRRASLARARPADPRPDRSAAGHRTRPLRVALVA